MPYFYASKIRDIKIREIAQLDSLFKAFSRHLQKTLMFISFETKSL